MSYTIFILLALTIIILVISAYILIIKYCYGKNNQNDIEIFRLQDNNFHLIINRRQYRFVENTNNFAISKTYNFPNGSIAEGSCVGYTYDNYQYLISKFKESEQADIRRKQYEAEMFINLSDSFTKLDEKDVK